MNKAKLSDPLDRFPATLELHSGKSAEGRSFALPWCPARRPKSGRRPAGFGLPGSDSSLRVPAPLRSLLHSANETDSFPWATSLRNSPNAAQLLPSEVRLLIGVLECLGSLTTGRPTATVVPDDLTVTMGPSTESWTT